MKNKIIGISLLSVFICFTALSPTLFSQERNAFETIASYEIREDQIIFDFELINNHDSAKILQLGSGQQFEVMITNEDGEEVYRYSDGRVFTLALIYKVIEPGESLKWQDKWNLTNKDGARLSSGNYIVEIKVLALSNDSALKIPDFQLTTKFNINLESEIVKYEIQEISDAVISAIHDKDAEKLSKFVHPVKGVRFTPYTYVSLENDLVIHQEEIKNFFTDENKYLWGNYDGTGWKIQLTPSEYYEKFIYTHDFLNAEQIGYNEVLSYGNMIENQFEVYEKPIIVEYYFPGFNPDYAGMDWRSLRLAFEQYQDSWKLVGVISNQWTI